MYEIEVAIQASPHLIYQYISTATGLAEWFADDVNFKGDLFTFSWDDSNEFAKFCSKKANDRVKFRWLDEDKKETDYYLEIKIVEDDITKDVSLIINDFAFESEKEESIKLWKNQVNDLKKILGSA